MRHLLAAIEAAILRYLSAGGHCALSEGSACAAARALSIMDLCHSLVSSGKRATQREVYYTLRHLFATQRQCDYAISRVCCLIGVPRHSLGILGLVALSQRRHSVLTL
jgi:DNA topoisomerase VI subunit A